MSCDEMIFLTKSLRTGSRRISSRLFMASHVTFFMVCGDFKIFKASRELFVVDDLDRFKSPEVDSARAEARGGYAASRPVFGSSHSRSYALRLCLRVHVTQVNTVQCTQTNVYRYRGCGLWSLSGDASYARSPFLGPKPRRFAVKRILQRSSAFRRRFM